MPKMYRVMPQKRQPTAEEERVRALPALPVNATSLSPDLVSALRLLIDQPSVLCMLKCIAAHPNGCTVFDMEKYAIKRGVYRRSKPARKPGVCSWVENRKRQLALHYMLKAGGITVCRKSRVKKYPTVRTPWVYRITDIGKLWLYVYDNVDMGDI